jgi:hypothetical protein
MSCLTVTGREYRDEPSHFTPSHFPGFEGGSLDAKLFNRMKPVYNLPEPAVVKVLDFYGRVCLLITDGLQITWKKRDIVHYPGKGFEPFRFKSLHK